MICIVNNCNILSADYVTDNEFIYVEAAVTMSECKIALNLVGVDIPNIEDMDAPFIINGTIRVGELTALVEPITGGDRITIISPSVRISDSSLCDIITENSNNVLKNEKLKNER